MKAHLYRIHILVALVIAALITPMSESNAYRYADIDLEFATVDNDSWNLTDSGVLFKEKQIDHNNVSKPYLSSWTPHEPGRSLKFQINPLSPDTGLKQRVEYYAYRSAPFEQTIHIGFSFSVHSDPSEIKNWVLISQIQQMGYFVSPFVGLELRNNDGQMELVLIARNTSYYWIDNSNGPNGGRIELGSFPIEKDDWYDVVLKVHPGPDGDGVIALYLDGELVIDWTGALGFPEGFLGRPFIETFQNAFGIYRKAQEGELIVYIDNYRVSDVIFSAVP
ncbi:MAG: heparin lyase I family protein [Puniceicoccales bacterium]